MRWHLRFRHIYQATVSELFTTATLQNPRNDFFAGQGVTNPD
jgi:hypothetical protein